MTAPEQRRFVRYEVRTEVEFELDGRRHRCQTDDLGAGGCRITTPHPMERGLALELSLGAGPSAARGRATVAWATVAEPYRIGLAFSDALAEQAIRLILAQLGEVALRTDKP
jgi:hypothetical protein